MIFHARFRGGAIFPILVLAAVLRLVHIDAPVLSAAAWRQADTAAIARNYFEGGYDFAHPQIDWGGASAGYVETEFPIYSFIAALLYRLFGSHEAVGRGLACGASLIGIAAAYLLIQSIAGRRTALWTAALLAFLPLNVYYGRAFMPEAWMLAASVLGIFFLEKWSEGRSNLWAVLAAASVSLACLLKLPALYLGLPLLYLFRRRHGSKLLIRPLTWLCVAIVVLPVVLWYMHAHGIFLRSGLTFGIWGYGTDKWGNWDLIVTPRFWNRLLFRSLAERHLTWPGFLLMVVGVFLKRRSPKERLIDVWAVSVLIYFLVVARGNYVHEYYQLPLAIPACAYAAKTLSRLSEKASARVLPRVALGAVVVAIAVLSMARLLDYWNRERPGGSATYLLAQEIKGRTPAGSRIVALDKGDPTLLYLAHRKGWHAHAGELSVPALKALRDSGADYLAGLKKDMEGDEGGEGNGGRDGGKDLKGFGALEAAFAPAYQDRTMFILALR